MFTGYPRHPIPLDVSVRSAHGGVAEAAGPLDEAVALAKKVRALRLGARLVAGSDKVELWT